VASRAEMIAAIASGIAALAAFAGFGYYLGRDTATSEIKQLEREIELFKAAQDTKNVLSYLEDLQKYNENLFEFSAHEEEVSKLVREIEELSRVSVELKSQLEEKNSELERLAKEASSKDAEIKALESELVSKYTITEDFSITAGKSKAFFEGEFVLGVNSIYNNYIHVTAFDQLDFLDIGESLRFSVRKNHCVLTLMGVDTSSEPDVAQISFACREARQDN
jgi:seryl-tRNA synthetase